MLTLTSVDSVQDVVENLVKSWNADAVSENLGSLQKVMELSGKNLLCGKHLY